VRAKKKKGLVHLHCQTSLACVAVLKIYPEKYETGEAIEIDTLPAEVEIGWWMNVDHPPDRKGEYHHSCSARIFCLLSMLANQPGQDPIR
jgi:hypothetical protein